MKRIAQFHPAQWNEPLIMTMGKEGERGIQIPPSGEKISTAAGNALEQIPASIRRKARPNLPEVSQPGVYRHYLLLPSDDRAASCTGCVHFAGDSGDHL